MTFTIEIQPRSPFGTDRDERLADAESLAKEIAQLDGVEKTECFEKVQKGLVVFENPVVVAAAISAGGAIVREFLKGFFQLLREKRQKGTYEAFSLHIHNNYFHLANDTAASVEADIEKMVEDALRKRENK
jgi:hypothetical protein